MTRAGYDQLDEELRQLRAVERPAVIRAIAEAREHGDLSENAEYHAAREKQSFVEGRIKDIEAKLSHAQVIDIASLPPDDKVIFGATVTVINLDTDETRVYQIVGDDEADVKSGKISYQSPIARALIGKREGDEVAVQTPSGTVAYEIDRVAYA
jgi:transcription elongation factor GreA